MSFDPTNEKHKAQLYPVLKALADRDPLLTPELVLDKAVGHPIPHGTDYASNMRRGRIRKSYAQLAFDWLLQNHFDLAHETSPNIFPQTPEQRWREILDERATTDTLRIVLAKSTLGIVQRDSALEAVDTTLKHGQRFLLEYTSDAPGYAIALQGIGPQWHPIPLGADGQYSVAIEPGPNLLPTLPNGQPDPLSENHHEGPSAFVIVCATEPEIPVDKKWLVAWVEANAASVAMKTVRFVA